MEAISTTTSWKHHRARVAALSRDRRPDDPDLMRERLALKEARLADYITKTLEAAPPLSNDQRARLAVLLRGGAA